MALVSSKCIVPLPNPRTSDLDNLLDSGAHVVKLNEDKNMGVPVRARL